MINPITDKVKNHLCADWQGKVTGQESMEDMLSMFIAEPQWQEYCLGINYPSIEQLESISKVAEGYGVLVNKTKEVSNPPQLFLFGESRIRVKADATAVVFITARHTSKVVLNLAEEAIAHITLYDDAICEHPTNANVKIFKR